jgi:hypothetical protein
MLDPIDRHDTIGYLQKAREWIMSQGVTDYQVSKALSIVLDLINERESELSDITKP